PSTPEYTRSGPYAAHPRTPEYTGRSPAAHQSPLGYTAIPAHPSTPGTPQPRGRQPTRVHPSVPMPNDLARRLLSLLPELEAMVARERDRQQLLSTPIGTPRHTVKKTYVVDTLYVDLIERYARTEGLELKA